MGENVQVGTGERRVSDTDRPIGTVLGADIGSTNTKVVLVEVRAAAVRDVASASAPTPATAEGLVATVTALVAQVLAGGQRAPDAVGIASMAETGVPLDADGRPLVPLLRWDGHRAGAQAEDLVRTHGRLELFGATGVRPSAKAPLATLAWLRTAEPEVFRRMAGWAGAADVVALALTGRLVTDHTLAGRTMAYRLPTRGGDVPPTFDRELLGLVGLRPEQLPAASHPEEVAGLVRSAGARTDRRGSYWADAASAFRGAGVRAGTPVVVAGHDHAVGAWAAGVRAPGDRADSIGTAEAVLTVLADPPHVGPRPGAVADAGMSWVRTVSGRHDALLAGSASAGSMVGWLVDRLLREPAGLPPDVVLEAVRSRLDADPSPSGVLVLPYLHGRQSPAPDPGARALVLPADASGERLAQAVLEGLCLQARWMLDAQSALAYASVAGAGRSGVTVLGGPTTTNPAWAAIKARVGPGPLSWVTAREPVATGAALLAAVRAGLLGDDVGRLLAGGAPALTTSSSAPSARSRSSPPPSSSSASASPTGAGPYDAVYADFVTAALAATT
ncbi:MAG: Carbohydrate kinase, FGGY-like protein [Actinotalea sp.]|nr:Carbohydrate kinase, FGGY-like protein [Actinotalea sp.]